MPPPSGLLEERQAHTAQSIMRQQLQMREDFEMRWVQVARFYNLIFISKWLVTRQSWDVAEASTASLPWAPLPSAFSVHSGCIFGKVTHWRRPGRGRRARRKSRKIPPRTGARTRCCRSSVLKADWRSGDGAGSCRRRCFAPGNHGRLSEALCCCCCLYDWRQNIKTVQQL